jgi:hypothetical protein
MDSKKIKSRVEQISDQRIDNKKLGKNSEGHLWPPYLMGMEASQANIELLINNELKYLEGVINSEANTSDKVVVENLINAALKRAMIPFAIEILKRQREQIGVLTQQRRDRDFTNRLVGLLLKAQGGVDYTRDVDENDDKYEDSMHVTIAETAKGYGVRLHGTSISTNDTVSHEDWKKANRLVSSCLHYLLNGEISEKASVIKSKIEDIRKLLPERKLNAQAVKMTLRAIEETYTVIVEYIAGNAIPI